MTGIGAGTIIKGGWLLRQAFLVIHGGGHKGYNPNSRFWCHVDLD